MDNIFYIIPLNINLNFFRKTSKNNHVKYIRRSNLNKLIFAKLNMNSTRNKFESVVKDIGSNIDLHMFSETEINDSFQKGQFLIKGFGYLFRIDTNVNGENVNENFMLAKISQQSFFLFKLDQKKAFLLILIYGKKWSVSYSYNPHRDNISSHLQTIYN